MTGAASVRKNAENRKIPNPSLTGVTRVFSPQIRRKLEFSSIIPYNNSTVGLCATKAAVWVYSHAAYIFNWGQCYDYSSARKGQKHFGELYQQRINCGRNI